MILLRFFALFLLLASISPALITPAAAAKMKKQQQTTKNEAPRYSAEYLAAAITEAAEKVGVPSVLLNAICNVESNLTAHAFVFNDGGDNNHAIGMCQVLVNTGDALVGSDTGCRRNFTGNLADRNYKNCKLFGPKTNALAAAKYLKEKVDRYNGNLLQAAAAYNAGSVKECRTGFVRNEKGVVLYRCTKGRILNERYVLKVAKNLPEGYFAHFSRIPGKQNVKKQNAVHVLALLIHGQKALIAPEDSLYS